MATTNDEEGRTSTKLRNSTRAELEKIGSFNESYDDVVSRLVWLYNNGTIKNKGKKSTYEDKV